MSAILEKIKLEGTITELIAKSNGENVKVNYDGAETTLASALTSIYNSVSNLPTDTGVDNKISAAIDGLIGGAPETYNTLKKLSDYITEHQDVVDAINSAITGKVDKVEGKGLSTEDFTTALKTKLESLPTITADDVTNWNDKAGKSVATTTADGLMSAADKTRLDGIRGVRYGAEAPADMQDGELFVQVVSE